MYRYFILTITLIATMALCLWPDFHPEQRMFHQYYWQVDVLIHGGYYFVVCILMLLLRFKPKPIYIGIALFVFSFFLELLQNFSSQRSVSPLDILSNFVGIGLAVGAMLIIPFKKTPNPTGGAK